MTHDCSSRHGCFFVEFRPSDLQRSALLVSNFPFKLPTINLPRYLCVDARCNTSIKEPLTSTWDGTYHTVRRWSVWFAFNFKPMPLKAMGLQELGLELPRILGSNVNRALCHLGSKDLARSMSLNISSPNQDAAPNCHI